MSDFTKKRRESLMDETSFKWDMGFTINELLPELLEDSSNQSLNHLDRMESKRRLGHEYFRHAIRLYSAGYSLEEITSSFISAIDRFDDFVNLIDEGSDWPQLDLAIQTYYVDALWLLSMTKLLGLREEYIEKVVNLYAADETNDGADELFELIIAKLGRNSYEAEGVIHEDPYELLLDCVKAEPEDRPKHMTAFLKRWFKGQKECDWWGMHINRTKDPILKTGFFGYWAFEAALVTYLWDIDDSSYSNLPHYPKDLIDYAREHFPLNGEPKPPTLSCPAGEPCPREGYWHTPAQTGSRRYFKQGEIMPKLQSDWGSVIWYWDESQT